jgi:SAM-dependent methyltransferase
MDIKLQGISAEPDAGQFQRGPGDGQAGNGRTAESLDVRAFYERAPYPAPLTTLDEHRDLYQNQERRRALFHLLLPSEPFSGNQEILVAGCGTSQAAKYALREPDARVTAIDISETSLGHTRDLQQKYDLKNLELHRLAIEEIGSLGRTFDQIVCTGVLHHLPDPEAGLRALRDVLDLQGAINLMVYAPYGRAGIYMMQEYCRLLEIGYSPEDLSQLADALESLPSSHQIAEVMNRARDFSHPDALADTLLHPRDRAYSVPQLFELLDRGGMQFGRWMYQAPYLAACGMVAGSPHAKRLAALPAPQQYAAVELFRGAMDKHNLIAYRNDRVGEAQPVCFDGDRWRNYVPLPLPWTICVRERRPPGSAGVLINRAHPFSDLILPISASEERLLGMADGKRTLGEVLAASRDVEDCRALGLFKKLWQYDQIVFDTSRKSSLL